MVVVTLEVLKEIKNTEFPEKYLDIKKQVRQAIVKKVMSGDAKLDDGQFPLGYTDKEQDLVLLFIKWIATNNEIIGNLNIVLNDIRTLPFTYTLLKGDPLQRYKFLVRTFFYEFYRVREKYNQITKALIKEGFIEKQTTLEMRNLFHLTFKDTITLRNALVHGSVVWRGTLIADLQLIKMARKANGSIQSKETGETWDETNILTELCNESADELSNEGNRVSKFLSSLILLCAEEVSNK